MGRRTVLPPSVLVGQGDLRRRLQDMQAEQQAIRNRNPFAGWEVAEFVALRNLVRSIWRDKGLIEASQDEPGIVYVGYFVDGPDAAPVGLERRRVLPFKGRTLAEIRKQIVAWRASS